MEIELDPPRGITGIPLGISQAEAVTAAARYGDVTVSEPQGPPIEVDGRPLPQPTKVIASGSGFEVVVHLETDDVVTAVEIWRPRDPEAEVRVLYDGIDMFRTPARELLSRLEQRGLTVDRSEAPDYAFVPGLSLGFTRVAGHEVPLDTDGEPLYFEAVLIGGTDYYGPTG